VTVNVARLVAGTADFVDSLAHGHHLLGTSNQINVVPDRAVAEGEVRFLATREGRQVMTRLEALVAKLAASSDVEVAFHPGKTVQPVDPRGASQKLVERAVEFAAARGWRLEVEEDRGGVSFPNYLTEPTRVPILDGLGPVGEGMHTRGECVDLRSLARRSVLLADLLTDLAAPKSSRVATDTAGKGARRPATTKSARPRSR
jgi:glutamate carboxypeptidase